MILAGVSFCLVIVAAITLAGMGSFTGLPLREGGAQLGLFLLTCLLTLRMLRDARRCRAEGRRAPAYPAIVQMVLCLLLYLPIAIYLDPFFLVLLMTAVGIDLACGIGGQCYYTRRATLAPALSAAILLAFPWLLTPLLLALGRYCFDAAAWRLPVAVLHLLLQIACVNLCFTRAMLQRDQPREDAEE